MHILHLQSELKIACGITKTIYLLVKNTSQEINHSVFTLGGDAIERFRDIKINVAIYPKKYRGLLQSIAIFAKIFSLVKKQKIDIIHSHHRYFDLIAFIISKLISVRTIVSVQSKVYGKKLFSYKSDFLIACSNSIKEHLVNYFRIDLDRVTVIHNFVDPKETALTKGKSALKKELGLDDSLIVIGFIGRFSIHEKGVDILLEAFNRISHECKNLKLIMIGDGDGDDKNFVNHFIAKNNLNGMILSPKENIYDYYDICDIIVLPSRVEPFGIVAIEAGLMKKPLVASSIDGLKEIIDSGINGILFQSENVELLTYSLRTLIYDKNLRTRFGEELYMKVLIKYTSDKIIPLYKKIYEQCMIDDGKSFENS
jgi:glycosyltransferase involved in cell wall biosynthesis